VLNVKYNLQDGPKESPFFADLNSCFIASRNEGLVRPGAPNLEIHKIQAIDAVSKDSRGKLTSSK
jgi:hypothetical protein